MGMKMGAQSWFPVASRTSGDGPRIGSIHDISTCRKQGDHLPVARIGVLAVVGAADEKERPLATGLHPARPRLLQLDKFQCESELIHQAAIEGERTLEIRDPNVDVGQHAIALPSEP